jgi:hypothetical protein
MGSDQEASLPQFPSFRESGAKSKNKKALGISSGWKTTHIVATKKKTPFFSFFIFAPSVPSFVG